MCYVPLTYHVHLCLTHSSQYSISVAPKNIKKFAAFFKLSMGIEMEHWPETNSQCLIHQ